jgi:hypothetical protein
MNKADFEKILASPDITDRDKVFITDLMGAFERYGRLSDRQEFWFNKISDKYSDEAKADFASWTQEYKEKHLERAKIVAEYYIKTQYYTGIAQKILARDEYVPDREYFTKFAYNKYAEKAYLASTAEAMFKRGDWAVVRATLSYNHIGDKDGGGKHIKPSQWHNKKILVVGEVKTGCQYKTLLAMRPDMADFGVFRIEERRLKGGKRKKKS